MDYLTYPFHFPQAAALHDETQQQQRIDAQLEQLACDLDSSAGSSSHTIDDNASGHSVHRSISSLSSASSAQIREHHISAFSKLRTAIAPVSDDAIPEEWKSYEPPSLVKGDWRSFGPTEAVLTVIERNRGAEKHHVRHGSPERKPSTLWRGTIWLTETHLIFVLDLDAGPERAEQESHTENWVHSLKRMLSHSHKEADLNEESEALPLNDPTNGRPITGFEVPLSSLKKVSYKKPSKHAAKRDSVASSSQGALSPMRSRTISPALSRVQSRNARSSSHAREALSPEGAPTPNLNNDVQAEQAVDFGQLVNRRDDPVIVRVYSEDDIRSVKVDLRFLSSLYQEKAKDLAFRLKEHLKRK